MYKTSSGLLLKFILCIDKIFNVIIHLAKQSEFFMKQLLSALFILCLIGCSTTTTKINEMNDFDITLEPAVFDNKFPALYVHIKHEGKCKENKFAPTEEISSIDLKP